MTGLEVRLEALANLERTDAAVLLRERFQELVVHEAQDCSYLTVKILEGLHDQGLPLVLVADPDQAIYEWNGASPDHLSVLADRLPQCIDLNGNWRSTQNICNLAATWRHHQDAAPDTSVTADPSRSHPLLLLPYATNRDQRRHTALHSITNAATTFGDDAADQGIPQDEHLLLSYRLNGLPASSREAPTNPPRRRDLALAWAVGSVDHPSSAVRQAGSPAQG